MTRDWRLHLAFAAAAALAALAWVPRPARAYIEASHSLGQVVGLSTNIVLMKVKAVDRAGNRIVYAKVRDLKGVHKQEEIRHHIGTFGFEPREWQTAMNWAEVGKEALFFHNGGQSETALGMYWYQADGNANDPNGWWRMTHGEPFLLRSFAGRLDKLVSAVTDMLAGKEVIVPCMVDGNKDDLKAGRAKIQRLRASLKLANYDAKRDFVGWGGEDFRRLAGMPGFSHLSTLPRVDPGALSVAAVDVNGDGRADVCLGGAGRAALLVNNGDSLAEVSLPAHAGCRAAVWADYNADGRPDLLLATPAGPKLFTNLGKGQFRDDTALLPREPGYNLTCAAWIDYDGDGRPDVLLGNGWHGLRLYRNRGKAPSGAKAAWLFEDASDAAGLGPNGVGGSDKGDSLTVCDLDGDGRPDFLYGAGTGVVARNAGGTFVAVADSGVRFETGRVGPAVGDFDGDGLPDLFVPQKGGCKLFRNDGKFRFTDVTEKAGLGKVSGRLTAAAWGDLDDDGRPDLVVGRLRAGNLFLRNKGDGTFTDASASVGLDTRVFNTQAVGLADLNNDGALDVVFNNEGQEPVVLLGEPRRGARRSPVTLPLAGRLGLAGTLVRVTDGAGALCGTHHVSGGDGRSGQSWPVPRFALTPGTYRVDVRPPSGRPHTRNIVVTARPLRAALTE